MKNPIARMKNPFKEELGELSVLEELRIKYLKRTNPTWSDAKLLEVMLELRARYEVMQAALKKYEKEKK